MRLNVCVSAFAPAIFPLTAVLMVIVLLSPSKGHANFTAPSGSNNEHQGCLNDNADAYNDLLEDVDEDYQDALDAADIVFQSASSDAQREYLEEVTEARIWALTNPVRYVLELLELKEELEDALEDAREVRRTAYQSAAQIHNRGQRNLYDGWRSGNRACDAENRARERQGGGSGSRGQNDPGRPNVPTTPPGSGGNGRQGSVSGQHVGGGGCEVTENEDGSRSIECSN